MSRSMSFLSALTILLVAPAIALPDHIFLNRQTARLLATQFNETQEYISGPLNFPVKQFQTGGLWSSTIRLNTVGNLSFWRDDVLLLDNNFYVTAMVLHFLWELRDLGVETAHDAAMDAAVAKAVPALHSFQDRNHAPSELIISFWLQSLMNSSQYDPPPPHDVYCATTANIDDILSGVAQSPEEVEAIKLLLVESGHADLWRVIGPYFNPNITWASAFGIVADGDDTSVALALSTLLLESPHFNASDAWLQPAFTRNISSYAANAVQYAYRPFSHSSDANNLIDPRTYFWLRHFLYQARDDAWAQGRQPDIALIVTWLESNSEVVYYARHNYCYRMSINVNNVDLSVAANAVFAMTRSLFAFESTSSDNGTQWFTRAVQQVYWNTTSLLIFAVEHKWVETRPDIVLLYYPAASDFYWYFGRILSTLRKIARGYPQLFEEYAFLAELYQRMEAAATSVVTQSILSEVQHHGAFYVWDGFIGLADANQDNEPTPHYYDRVFQTGMFSNALLYIWTDRPGEDVLQWREDTPSIVKQVLRGSVEFLRTESFDEARYRPDNAFFSGSVKVMPQTSTFVYPQNYKVLFNGTALPASDCNQWNAVSGVKGVIDDETYSRMMEDKPCNQSTPTEFAGYNQYSHAWPFWNSHAITHASTLLAVARFDRIDEKQ